MSTWQVRRIILAKVNVVRKLQSATEDGICECGDALVEIPVVYSHQTHYNFL